MVRIAPRLAAVAAFVVALAACGGSSNNVTATDVGVTNDSILLGTTIALSGGAAAYGTIANAENAYFTYVNNNQGGVNGRKINFKILDDAYNPAQTVPLTKQLVEQDQVFLMSTGATTWGKDFGSTPWTMSWQPPYQGEAHIYAKDVLKNHPNAKIGVLYQNDDYGQDYLKGLTDGLGDKASMIVAKESFDVTAANPFAQLTKLKAANVDTLFLFSTPKPSIQSLAFVTGVHWAPTIYLNSVSNPQVYMLAAKKAGAALQNVTSVSYLKDPTDPQWDSDAGMKLYKQVIANCTTCNVQDGFNIYGVAVAYTMVDVLKKAGTNMTRKNIIDIAANQLNESGSNANPFLLPGVVVKTTSSDHFPIMQEQVITWAGTGWTLQGSLIDERGTIK